MIMKPGRPRPASDRGPWMTFAMSRAERELGFRASTGLEEGLRATIAWYRRAGLEKL